jgi:RNA polymerase sigma-70 factor (ECF subfamily)
MGLISLSNLMVPQPETRPSLIVRLTSPRDQTAWGEFLSLYEPLILRLMRRHGLQESDAHDVCQQVLAAVARDVGQWKPDGRQASFRRWLFQVSRNRLLKYLTKERGEVRGTGGTDAHLEISRLPDGNDSIAVQFEREFRQQLLAWGAQQIRGEFQDSTWQAFWRTCVGGQTVAEVATELGTTAGNVYVARSRIIARLREKVREVEHDDV